MSGMSDGDSAPFTETIDVMDNSENSQYSFITLLLIAIVASDH